MTVDSRYRGRPVSSSALSRLLGYAKGVPGLGCIAVGQVPQDGPSLVCEAEGDGEFSAKRAEFQIIFVISSTSAISALADESPTWPVQGNGGGQPVHTATPREAWPVLTHVS